MRHLCRGISFQPIDEILDDLSNLNEMVLGDAHLQSRRRQDWTPEKACRVLQQIMRFAHNVCLRCQSSFASAATQAAASKLQEGCRACWARCLRLGGGGGDEDPVALGLGVGDARRRLEAHELFVCLPIRCDTGLQGRHCVADGCDLLRARQRALIPQGCLGLTILLQYTHEVLIRGLVLGLLQLVCIGSSFFLALRLGQGFLLDLLLLSKLLLVSQAQLALLKQCIDVKLVLLEL
mmetsp:Transcript_77692/g.196206  ORF Transcript_77692/g.196206 Transcript_77692/m.196206 type:complete len:236 (-) Transcript_77692:765-1472(-)